METYFGVTPAESALSGTLAAYSPGGGFKSVGAELNVRYEFAPQWAIRGEFIYEKLIGDAADSPIVQVGKLQPIYRQARPDLHVQHEAVRQLTLHSVFRRSGRRFA